MERLPWDGFLGSFLETSGRNSARNEMLVEIFKLIGIFTRNRSRPKPKVAKLRSARFTGYLALSLATVAKVPRKNVFKTQALLHLEIITIF